MPTTRHYDIVIIGGGIQGAAVAQAAAALGYNVLVLEKLLWLQELRAVQAN